MIEGTNKPNSTPTRRLVNFHRNESSISLSRSENENNDPHGYFILEGLCLFGRWASTWKKCLPNVVMCCWVQLAFRQLWGDATKCTCSAKQPWNGAKMADFLSLFRHGSLRLLYVVEQVMIDLPTKCHTCLTGWIFKHDRECYQTYILIKITPKWPLPIKVADFRCETDLSLQSW